MTSKSSSSSSSEDEDGRAVTGRTTIKQTKTSPQWREAVAGACAGAFSKTTVAPVERIKLVLQVQGSIIDNTNTTSSASNNSQQQRRFLSAWQITNTIYQNEGMVAFWRGNLSNVIRTSGTAGINFMMMDYYKKVAVIPSFLVGEHNKNNENKDRITRKRKLITSFLSGGLAGGTSTTILYPIEFIRTRLGADLMINYTNTSSNSNYKFIGIRHTFWSIYQSDGLRGFYQGYGIALSGSVLYRLLLLGSYDALKEELPKLKRKKRNHHHTIRTTNNNINKSVEEKQQQPSLETLTWLERILVAQTVSLLSGTMVYPIDSVRRRLMMQAGVQRSERLYKHSFHCFATIWKQEGIQGFYLGLGPNILRSIGGAILLVAYDACKVVLF